MQPSASDVVWRWLVIRAMTSVAEVKGLVPTLNAISYASCPSEVRGVVTTANVTNRGSLDDMLVRECRMNDPHAGAVVDEVISNGVPASAAGTAPQKQAEVLPPPLRVEGAMRI